MRLRLSTHTLVLAAAMAVASCSLEKTYRCELVVETSTSRGTEHWNGVYEVTRHLGPDGYKAAGWRAQAIPIGIGAGKFVYALPIGSDHRDNYLPLVYLGALGDHAPWLGRFLGRTEVWPRTPETHPIMSYAPMIVRFANDADPDTLGVVAYDSGHPEIAPGVRIQAISIRRTSKALRFDLDKYLPWLHAETEPYKMGPPWVPLRELPNGLHSPDFMRGAPGHVPVKADR